jgi:hypothetical protein
MPTKYEQYVERKKAEYGERFTTSALDKRFIPYLNSGERIKVDFGHGDVKTGTVSVTTGWKPTFLLMLRSNSMGSIYTLGRTAEIIGVQTGGTGRGKRFYPISNGHAGK